ncbi:hypothetical protein ACH47B_13100 [Rhodococcus sp. NPDC019627]|uniref:hypothetical protein n=1 Tax=unclassified Rhodococcus (in: high G+C Gram-positive bacteria) TaxID=192944 RepID=UPI0033D79989
MNAILELLAIAGEDTPDGFAGYCTDCGRGRYRAWYAKEGQERGWVYAASADKCFTCHRRPTRVLCPLCKSANKEFRGIGMCGGCREVWESDVVRSVAAAS